jgi:hypothetical protein
MTYSSLIDDVIAAAEAEGNHVDQVSSGWTKVREVAHMACPMSDELRARTLEKNSLRYWSSKATPHNRVEERFTDDIEKVSISFPA